MLHRRSTYRLGKIEHRLEVLGGYLIAYLNLDEVIRIIRYEDHPKQELMQVFALSDVQAEAILNMRLRALRKLEELEIRKEHDGLSEERVELEALLGSDEKQWARIAEELRQTRRKFGETTELGARRTGFADAPAVDVDDIADAMIEKEPVTVVLSEKGWIRAMKGHLEELGGLHFKKGDRLKRAVRASTTDDILLFATNGKFYTLGVDRLPGGRGQGEPLRLMIDLDETNDVVEMFTPVEGRKLLVASTAGNGFVVPESDVVANTRKGKQVLNVTAPDEALLCAPVSGDMISVIGDNRKLLVCPLDEVNEMSRGRGVRLQRYSRGGLADAKVFARNEGLTWTDSAGRLFTQSQLEPWLGSRAQAGKMAPKGFPRANSFGPRFK